MGIYRRNRHSGWATEGEGDPAGPGKRVRGTQEAANTVGTPSVSFESAAAHRDVLLCGAC